ncbi:MAG: cytochrome c biogenesis CcdA family protein [Spirochaetaceae bacterium]|jgi:cytochrome c-type biogenesis protein|nr:cytochrome c biogenesis CcdA family protein [Spirochaetaceae bacterium]
MDANLSIVSAFVAGILSFVSPCVLPLISSYLVFIGGNSPPAKRNLIVSTLFFIFGFSIVFIALSIVVYGFMFFLGGITKLLNIIAGAFVVLLGVNTLFNFIPFLKYDDSGERCDTCMPEHSILAAKKNSIVHPARRPKGVWGALIVGIAFGIGWTPCVGVILGSILVMASQSGKMALSVVYLVVYSAGLGVPFLITSFLWGALIESGAKLKHFLSVVRIISGIFLIAIGVVIIFGRYSLLTSFLQTGIDYISGI